MKIPIIAQSEIQAWLFTVVTAWLITNGRALYKILERDDITREDI